MYSSLYLLSTVLLYTTYCSKKNVVVHQTVLVEYYYYCCFHLNYGTSDVGPDVIIRNKKRSLLCAPHPQRSEFKICGSLAANKRQNISAEPVCSSEHSVQNFITVAYSCRASVFLAGLCCVHPPTMRERRQNLHVRWCLCFPVRGIVEQQLCLLLQISPTCEKKILRSTLPFPAIFNLPRIEPRLSVWFDSAAA